MGRIDEILRQKPTIYRRSSSHHRRAAQRKSAVKSSSAISPSPTAFNPGSANPSPASPPSPPRSRPASTVLHNVNLKIPAGTSLAIVGPTGSGKSTLVSLIPRINDAAPGSVLIDGRPIREYSLETLRRQIGFVPQETFLFSATIRENIAFGVEDATDEQVRGRR